MSKASLIDVLGGFLPMTFSFDKIAAVLFDLDGTLLDTASDLGGAANQMRLKRGQAVLVDELYRPVASAGARGMLEVAFGIGPEDLTYDELREEFLNNYERCMTCNTVPFEGVLQLIDSIEKRGLVWGVVTNKPARFTEPLARSMSLFASASVVVSGDSTPYAKPHPAPLLEAARRIQLAPTQCLYVGDDERDIVAGLSAGMGTVAANYGYIADVAAVRGWGAHAEINSPLDLLQFLPKA